jgi:TRAP-type C4-dicarboxylate transport system substrate-binding protein
MPRGNSSRGRKPVAHKFSLSVALIAALLTSAARLAAADTTNLIFATTEPAGSDDSMRVFSPWADSIGKAANGSLHIDLREGFAIANSTNIYDRVQSDVVQIGILIPSLIGGKFPLTDVAGLPFVTQDSTNASIAFWRLYKTGAFDQEYKDIVPLGFGLFPPQDVQLVKAPATLDNLNGLRLRVVGKLSSELVTRLGATPLVIDPSDQYTALERHTVDGVLSSWMSMGPLHLTDVTGYHIETSLGTGMFIIFMAHGKFASLPAATQQAILANSGESLSRAIGQGFEARAAASRAPAAADPAKHTIVQLSPAQTAEWAKAINPVIDEWTASHPGGAELLATYRKLIADVTAGK